jgi:hypothetical protein
MRPIGKGTERPRALAQTDFMDWLPFGILWNYYYGMDGLNEQSPILLKVKVRTGALVQLNVAGFRGVE